MKAALLAYIGLLEVYKAAFPSLVDVLEKIVKLSFPSVKQALLGYIGLVEQQKGAVLRKLKVLTRNRYVNFFKAPEPPRC